MHSLVRIALKNNEAKKLREVLRHYSRLLDLAIECGMPGYDLDTSGKFIDKDMDSLSTFASKLEGML